jgi:hypothetical protein
MYYVCLWHLFPSNVYVVYMLVQHGNRCGTPGVIDEYDRDPAYEGEDLPARWFSWRKLWRYTGPGFLMSIAYLVRNPSPLCTSVALAGLYFLHCLCMYCPLPHIPWASLPQLQRFFATWAWAVCLVLNQPLLSLRISAPPPTKVQTARHVFLSHCLLHCSFPPHCLPKLPS